MNWNKRSTPPFATWLPSLLNGYCPVIQLDPWPQYFPIVAGIAFHAIVVVLCLVTPIEITTKEKQLNEK